MIKPGEIQNRARKGKVRDQQIEKDYILSWILQGVSQHQSLAKCIIFKGGTVLKKVYFEDYRFSEDLDFTLLDETVANDQIMAWFQEIFEYVLEEANIPLEIIDPQSNSERPEHEKDSLNFYISYIGPLGGQGNHKKVKIDLSRNEPLVFEAIGQELILSYSDQTSHHLLCYSLQEVLVEKLRSVMQRMQPRDLYDIWYLLEIQGMDMSQYAREFNTKCANKGLNSAEFHNKLSQRLPQYKGRWQNSLAGQIHDLPDFGQVEREVMRHVKKFIP
jgi:uncharacterized protein